LLTRRANLPREIPQEFLPAHRMIDFIALSKWPAPVFRFSRKAELKIFDWSRNYLNFDPIVVAKEVQRTNQYSQIVLGMLRQIEVEHFNLVLMKSTSMNDQIQWLATMRDVAGLPR
jgi:hypothetical protein